MPILRGLLVAAVGLLCGLALAGLAAELRAFAGFPAALADIGVEVFPAIGAGAGIIAALMRQPEPPRSSGSS